MRFTGGFVRNTDGRRDLSLIRASGSTARVLNLLMVAERHGESGEYAAKPLFHNRKLNRALILKHAVRKHERAMFDHPVSTTTKIVLPFAAQQLEVGGVSILMGEERWDKKLRAAVGGYADEAENEADFDLLNVLNALPSFDPFLLRERLRHAGREPARCYFEIAEADVARMRKFVSREISQLIELAFAGGMGNAGDMSSKLSEKLMTDETAKSLDPLRQTLRLSGDDYVEGVFAWKGFLYYRWVMQEFKPQLEEFRTQFAACRVSQATDAERRAMGEMRKRIMGHMALAMRRVDESLLKYDTAFKALAEGQPAAFRNFLLEAPSMFIPIGEAVGVVKHVHSFWRFRFPAGSMLSMDGDEAVEVFHEFQSTLDAVQFVRAETASAVAQAS